MARAIVTKQKLADTLKILLAKTPLHKIAVLDVVNACGMNRQTFYYHFKDIYELAEWVFRHEILEDAGDINANDWAEVYLSVFRYAESHRDVFSNMLGSLAEDYLARFIDRSVRPFVSRVCIETAQSIASTVEDIEAVTEHFCHMLLTYILMWIKQGMAECAESVVGRIVCMIRGSMKLALENLAATHESL